MWELASLCSMLGLSWPSRTIKLELPSNSENYVWLFGYTLILIYCIIIPGITFPWFYFPFVLIPLVYMCIYQTLTCMYFWKIFRIVHGMWKSVYPLTVIMFTPGFLLSPTNWWFPVWVTGSGCVCQPQVFSSVSSFCFGCSLPPTTAQVRVNSPLLQISMPIASHTAKQTEKLVLNFVS